MAFVRKHSEKIGKEKYSEDLKIPVEDIRNIAISILGLFFIGSSLPNLVAPIVLIFTDDTLIKGQNWGSIEQFLQVGLQLAFGLLLLLYTQCRGRPRNKEI